MADAPRPRRRGKTVDLDDAALRREFHGAPARDRSRRARRAAPRHRVHEDAQRGAMTGAKAWRQKGTGRARVGALSTPQRVGGGVAFGPKPRRYTVKVNRKARRRALRSALAVHASRDSLAVVDPDGVRHPVHEEGRAGDEGARRQPHAGGARSARDRGGLAGPRGGACAKSFRNLAGVNVMPVRLGRRRRHGAGPLAGGLAPGARAADAARRPPASRRGGAAGAEEAGSERAHRPHPAGHLREELRAPERQQVHVPRPSEGPQDAGPPGGRGGVRRPRQRRPHDEREVEAEAPRLDLRARRASGRRRSSSSTRRTRSIFRG